MDYRTKTEIKFEADEDESPGPIKTYKLVKRTWHECRRSDRERWQMDTSQRDYLKIEELADGITRRQLVAIVTDGVEWLSYIEAGD